jgi:hypothetical protein
LIMAAHKRIQVVMDGDMRAYLRAADETQAEILASDSPLVAALRTYDAFFRTRLFAQGPSEPIALVLFMNAYQLFLAAMRMGLAGHSTAVFPLLRTALESAAYGGRIVGDPALGQIWTRRHRSQADKKACRKVFTFDKAVAGLKERAPDFHGLAVAVYEGAIDFGAHPNIKGVFGHVSLDEKRNDGFAAVKHTGLYSPAHIETVRGLCACLDFGLAIIGVIALSRETISEELVDDLTALNEAKNDAVKEYS